MSTITLALLVWVLSFRVYGVSKTVEDLEERVEKLERERL